MSPLLASLILSSIDGLSVLIAADKAEEEGSPHTDALRKGTISYNARQEAEEVLYGERLRYASTLGWVKLIDFVRWQKGDAGFCQRLINMFYQSHDRVKYSLVYALTEPACMEIHLSPRQRWKKSEDLQLRKVVALLGNKALIKAWSCHYWHQSQLLDLKRRY